MARGKKKEKELTPEEKLHQALVPEDEQPYELPGNWCWTILSAVCVDFIVPQRDKPKQFSGSIPWCRIEDIEGKYLNGTLSNQYVSKKTIDEMNLRVCPIGTVICSCSASLGVQAILTVECCTNQTFIGLVCSSALSNNYLYYYLRSLDQYWNQIGTGTTIKYISRKKYEILKTPLPPLAEQHRIVDRIESLFAKLDEAKEKAQAVVDGYEDRKAAILHKAFNGELTEVWRYNNCVSEESWELMTLNDVADYKKGPFGSSITKAMFVPKGDCTYKVYEQGNAIRKTLNYGHYYISEKKYEELKGFAVQGGDIIISCAGTIGELYKLPENCEAGVINQALMRVRLHSNIEEGFFSYYFGEIIKLDVINEANGTAIKNIPPFKVMKAMEIRLPSMDEQKAIVDILDKELQNEQQSKELAEQVIGQIDSMKKSILARAFRGELGTNDLTDESAEELLKRIL